MNRIILIGNGFDRAHGMETSYNHFIDDYWKNCVKEYNDQKSGIKYENEEIIIRKIRDSKAVKANSYVEFKAELGL